MNHDHPTEAVSAVDARGDQIERAMRRARHERSMAAKNLFLGVCARLTSLVAAFRQDQHHQTPQQAARP